MIFSKKVLLIVAQKLYLSKIYLINLFLGKHWEIDYLKNILLSWKDCDLEYSAIYFTPIVILQYTFTQSLHIWDPIALVW